MPFRCGGDGRHRGDAAAGLRDRILGTEGSGQQPWVATRCGGRTASHRVSPVGLRAASDGSTWGEKSDDEGTLVGA